MAKPWDLKADLFICFVEEGSCIIAPMHPSLAGVLIFKETFICAFQFHPKQFDTYVLFAAFSHADDGLVLCPPSRRVSEEDTEGLSSLGAATQAEGCPKRYQYARQYCGQAAMCPVQDRVKK